MHDTRQEVVDADEMMTKLQKEFDEDEKDCRIEL